MTNIVLAKHQEDKVARTDFPRESDQLMDVADKENRGPFAVFTAAFKILHDYSKDLQHSGSPLDYCAHESTHVTKRTEPVGRGSFTSNLLRTFRFSRFSIPSPPVPYLINTVLVRENRHQFIFSTIGTYPCS